MSFSSVKVSGSAAMPDRVYYNATVVNNTISTSQASDDPAIRFADTRQTPLIPDSSKYNLSVENFTLNGATKSLPVLIPQIIPGNTATITAVTWVTSFFFTIAVFTCDNWFQVGDKISSIQGLTATASVLNFTNTNFDSLNPYYTVTAATPTTFTINYPPSFANGTEAGQSAIATNFTRRNPADINSTAYFVTVAVFDGTNYCLGDAQVVWEPENITPYTLIPTSATPQIETDYYYCYNYSHFVYLVNNALELAWTNAKNISTSLGGTFGTQCPFFEFDPNSGLFSLNQDATTCLCPVGTALPPPFSTTFTATGDYQEGEYSFVGMNANLEGLLSNFSTLFFSVGPEWRSSGENLPENVIDMGLTNLNVTTGTVTGGNCVSTLKGQNPTTFFLTDPFTNNEITTSRFVKVTQDFVSTGSLWSPIASFVLMTTQIPVRNEGLANPVTLGDANIGTQNSSSGSFQRVLIEVPINAVTADIWRGWVLYEPLTPTLSSLEESKEGITELDLYVYWRNRLTNSLVPLRLYNTGTMTFRLMFEKRAL
jgi:hypothetical protein